MAYSSKVFLLGTVFLTGAAVLVIEVTAVRALSPYFGSSLYVFSSVLTIILAALSLGYYYGGRLADRMPTHPPLYGIIAVSGILTLLSQFLIDRVLPYSENVFSFLIGPLLFGSLLFFLPAFLLGIVSPYLIKLVAQNESPDKLGSTAGTVFFWGTLGSITGSLLTGFVLIPILGIQLSLVGTGIALILLGIGGLLYLVKMLEKISIYSAISRHSRFLLLIVVSAIVLIVFIYRSPFPYPYPVLYRSDGLYGHIIVYEIPQYKREPLRALRRDTNNESAIFLDSYDLVFEYTQFAEWYDTLFPNAKTFLMIGGGAYSVPRTLLERDPDIQISVVDIEPDLYPLAERFFDLQPNERLTNYVMDGRVFLNTNEKPFDVIFLDAFGTDLTLPAHLTTKEFFEKVKKNLSPEGILIINYIGNLETEAPSLTGSLAKTLTSVFSNTEMFGLWAGDPTKRQNIILVARNGVGPISLDDKVIKTFQGNTKQVKSLKVPLTPYQVKEELIFTDNRAPIEYLLLDQYR